MKNNHSYCCYHTEYMQHTQLLQLRKMREEGDEQGEGGSLRNFHHERQNFLNVNPSSSRW